MPLVRLHPWRAIQALFGFSSRGKAQEPVLPAGLQKLARDVYIYGKDPVSTWYRDRMALQTDRFEAYKEYDDADADDVVTTILDLYASDACQPDLTTGRVIWAESEDPETEKIADEFLQRIRADQDTFSIAREAAKYGDSFSAVANERRDDGTPGPIMQLIPAPPYAISRIEDEMARLTGFAVAPIEMMGSAIGVANPSQISGGAPTDPPWAFLHWRLRGRDRYTTYGTSMLAAARRPYRRMRMAEDALVLYRLRKSPDRFVFAIKGLGGLPPEDRRLVMERVRQELRKRHLINKDSGTVRSEMLPVGVDEDFVIDEESMAISRLEGSRDYNHITDVDYLRKRFFGTTHVPGAYLGFEDSKGVNVGETPLSFQDINFARVEKRLQIAVMEGYATAIMIDMAWRGMDPRDSKRKFTLHMNPVSALDEKQRAELERIRLDTIDGLVKMGSDLGLSSDEWMAYMIQRAQIPSHLLRAAGRDGDLLRGRVSVINESRKRQIDEAVIKAQGVLLERERAILNLRRHFCSTLGPNTLQSRMFIEKSAPVLLPADTKATVAEEWSKRRREVLGVMQPKLTEMSALVEKAIAEWEKERETRDETWVSVLQEAKTNR